MSTHPHSRDWSKPVAFGDLSRATETAFDLRPDREHLAALADQMGLLGLRKVRLAGHVAPADGGAWTLRAHLGATVVQPCVVTLAPVTTRIEEDVERTYAPDLPEPPAGAETEMPDDDSTDPLPEALNLPEVLAEALALALPLYPRAEGAQLGERTFAEPGTKPMTDDEARPFAALAGLRGKLAKKDE